MRSNGQRKVSQSSTGHVRNAGAGNATMNKRVSFPCRVPVRRARRAVRARVRRQQRRQGTNLVNAFERHCRVVVVGGSFGRLWGVRENDPDAVNTLIRNG